MDSSLAVLALQRAMKACVAAASMGRVGMRKAGQGENRLGLAGGQDARGREYGVRADQWPAVLRLALRRGGVDEGLHAGAQRCGHSDQFQTQHAGHFMQGGQARVKAAAFKPLHSHAAETSAFGQRGLGELLRFACLRKVGDEISLHA